MNLADVINLSQGALVVRKVGSKTILFIQIPGMDKSQIVAAVLKPEDLRDVAAFVANPTTDGWNRLDITIATAADLTGT